MSLFLSQYCALLVDLEFRNARHVSGSLVSLTHCGVEIKTLFFTEIYWSLFMEPYYFVWPSSPVAVPGGIWLFLRWKCFKRKKVTIWNGNINTGCSYLTLRSILKQTAFRNLLHI